MTDPALLGKSVLLGLAIAAPLGPIGALCINRTLDRGFAAGFAGGLGTALADATYAALAALGFATFAAALAVIDLPLRLLGGGFMLWLGLRGLTAAAGPVRAAEGGRRGLFGTAATTFVLTIANPATILSFAALFAGLGLAQDSTPARALLVTAGIFAGSLLWWLVLSGGVALARHRLPPAFSRWTARASGALLLLFGLWAVGSALLAIIGGTP